MRTVFTCACFIAVGFALLPIIVPSSECSDRNYLKSIRKRAYVCEIQGVCHNMILYIYICVYVILQISWYSKYIPKDIQT